MTIANTLGRAAGYTGALAVHAAKCTVAGTGAFGRDVVAGTQAGYAEHSLRLAAQRAAASAAAFTPPAIKVVKRAVAKA